MKVGPRARQLTEEVTTQIIQADKLFETATPEQRLRLNKKEMLAAAGVTVEHAVGYANRLTELVAESVVVAKEVCEWTKEGPVKPFHYKTRQEQRKNWNMITYRTNLRQACIQYRRKTAYSTDPKVRHNALRTAILELRNNAPASYLEHFPKPPIKNNADEWHTWSKACSRELGRVKQDKAQLQKEHDAKQYQAASRKVQQTYRTNKKKVNKQILGNATRQDIIALKDADTNEVHTEPAALKKFVHDYFKSQSIPATGNKKTGDFLPEQAARHYPWKSGPDSMLDTFNLETRVGHKGVERIAIEDSIRDKSIFQELVSGLSNNKTPGPDGVNNELLKHLPPSMHKAIHRVFILMWLTGATPDSWKASNTILLHKKNSELLLENYRPIALANTMYKLWTGLIQRGLSKYAEHYDILSSSQEGFRGGKNTIRQLHNLINVLSDAKITQQNLYMLYIDFSSAFNTIDHDKLLQTMYDLGFPTDAVNVIANLYTNATTRIKLPAGLTDPIDIDRGTIQGDTLSPLLFLIFIEPLLRSVTS